MSRPIGFVYEIGSVWLVGRNPDALLEGQVVRVVQIMPSTIHVVDENKTSKLLSYGFMDKYATSMDVNESPQNLGRVTSR